MPTTNRTSHFPLGAIASFAILVILASPIVSAQQSIVSVAQKIDRNHDRLIGRAEYHNHLRGTFFLSDLDKNGSVNATELSQVANMRFKQGVMETFDVDNDGGLDLHEFQRAFALDFEAADINQDGALDFKEFEAYFG